MDMKKAPQGFTEEFKTEALHQLTERDHPGVEAANRLDVSSQRL